MNPCQHSAPIQKGPSFDQTVLVTTRSPKVCMTCHCVRHLAGVSCIPLLTRRCQGWTKELARQRGWCPEVA
jgi:hypothetical protein